jgi:hypothetical protein
MKLIMREASPVSRCVLLLRSVIVSQSASPGAWRLRRE